MVRETSLQPARHHVSVGYGGAHGQLSTELEVRRRLAALDRQTSAAASAPAPPQPAASAMDGSDGSSPFECNICLEMSRDPVVTFCGHLYCWPCLYRWLQVDGKCRTCPVCKASVSKDSVVPIYGRGAEVTHDPREGEVKNIPARPSGKASSGSGLFSMFFGSSQSPPSLMNSIFILEEEINSPEHQHQAILARLLLMLGSFVIMFLLLI